MNNPALQNSEIILLIYGCAFFMLCMVIYVLPEDDDNKPSFFSKLWLLALFGVLHGSHEFITWGIFHFHPDNGFFSWLNGILVLLSYIPLVEFARYRFYSTDQPLKWNCFLTYGLIAVGVIAAMWLDHTALEGMRAAARLLIGFPGAVLTGIAIIRYGNQAAYANLQASLRVAGYAFMVYGVLSLLHPDSSSLFFGYQSGFTPVLPVSLIRLMGMVCMLLAIASLAFVVRRSHIRSREREATALLEIQEINDYLEQKVIERTRLLERVTEQLKCDLVERHQIEEALIASEVYQKAIFDATPDAMLITNTEGNIVMANRQAERLLGYSISELINQPIEFLVPEYARAHHSDHRTQYAKAPYIRAMGTGTGGVLVQRKDGGYLDVEISLSPIPTEQGFLFASALRDITDRKQAEMQLRASEERFRLMADSTPIMIWITDALGNPSFANRAWLEFVGIDSAASMSHDAWCHAVHPDDLESAFIDYYQNTQNHQTIATEYRLRHADGSWRWVFDQGMPLYDGNNQFIGYIGSLIDITERKEMEKALRESEAFVTSVLDSLPEHIAVLNSAGIIIAVNRAWRSFAADNDSKALSQNSVGLNYLEVCEKAMSHHQNTEAEAAKQGILAVQRGQLERFNMEYACHAPKQPRWFHMQITPLLGSESRIVIVHKNITERVQTEADLRVAAIAFETHEPMVITDPQSIILKVNRAFTESTGYTAEEAVGSKVNLLSSGHHDEAFYAAMWQSIELTGSWQGEIWDRRKNGEVYPKWLIITAVINKEGVVTHYVGIHADISERKNAEAKIHNLAYYDPLTQLPNRSMLNDRLKHALEMVLRDGKQMALLMLDLDRFKIVNDSFGHLVGDELLQQVARRLTMRLRSADTIARLGGDEFVVLLEEISHAEDAARIAEAIIHDLMRPFNLSHCDNIHIGVSIGISLCPQHSVKAETLFEQADAALYQAKADGRGCFAYFSEHLTLMARERIDLEMRLRTAIEQRQLRVFYQPQVDINTGRIIGAEALVRWQCPAEGLIFPDRFIHIAETSGLILSLGEWVLRETCRQGRQWLDAGQPAIILAVNVSPQQFRRVNLSVLVARVLAETGFPAELLEIEITESGLMEATDNILKNSHIDSIIETLNELRDLGVHLAIDDFGTGYSSLAYLKRFPLNMLKIDKSFIDHIPNDSDDKEIASTIIAMGHTLGLKVLAEGIETEEQLAFLQSKGCDYFQGYLKAKPLAAEAFSEMLLSNSL